MSAILEAVLPLGARYRMTAPTRPYRDHVLRYLSGLEDTPPEDGAAPRLRALREAAEGRIAIAFEDGGLLQWLDAWQNAVLPADFHAAEAPLPARRRARGIFAALGQDPDRLAGRPVSALTLFEARLVGFVKAMLMEADLLVLDGLLERLGGEEQRQVAQWIALFRSRYPLRRLLYVGLHDPGAALEGFAALEDA
jgi:ABC-type lipoprotein export system ATPase subunit